MLRTTAGTFPSNLIRVRTHTMTDTSGISVCFGNVQDEVLLENAKLALREMKAKWSDKIQIDTTHFVCTTPAVTPSGAQATGGTGGAPGVEYQRALQLSIPIVQPHWILACHSEKKYVLILISCLSFSYMMTLCRMVAISSYYLGATPNSSTTSSFTRPYSMSQASLTRSGSASSPPLNRAKSPHRASMPAPNRAAGTPPSNVSPFLNQNQPTSPERSAPPFESTPEENLEDEESEEVQLERSTSNKTPKSQQSTIGEMNPQFRFPSTEPTIGGVPVKRERKIPPGELHDNISAPVQSFSVVTPSSIEVPPPPPVEKERSTSHIPTDDGEDDVGDTVDIPLN